MTTTTKFNRPVCSIGEEIGLEMGQKFVKDFQLSCPEETPFYVIGKDILDKILTQSGCAGIKFYRAKNELGQNTLVYVGIDRFGKNLLEIISVEIDGSLQQKNGIVADRTSGPWKPFPKQGGISSDDFEWTID